MQKNKLLAAYVVIFAVLAIAAASSFFWGSMAPKDPRAEVFLGSFDKEVALGEKACVYTRMNSGYGSKTIISYRVIANNTVVDNQEFDITNYSGMETCIPAEALLLGDNFVEVFVGGDRLFYHLQVSKTVEEKLPVVSASFEGDEKLKVRVEENDALKYAPIEIYVNDELDHRVYFEGETFESVERIELRDGENRVEVLFKGEGVSLKVEKPAKFAMNPLLGISIIAALLFVFALGVFAAKPFLEKVAYSTLSVFAILMAEFFLLNVVGILSAANFAIAIALTTIALAIAFRKEFAKNSLTKEEGLAALKKISPFALLLIAILLFSSFAFNFFTSSYYSDWTSFYERQSKTITGIEQIPETDSFSFLGTKPFGYISGYFFVNSGVSWLTGLATQQSYAMIMLIAQAAFLATALLFFRSYNFDGKRSYIALLALFLGGFVFSDFSFNIRHVISYSFLLLAATQMRKGKALPAAIALGLGTFVQTPVFLMFIAMIPLTVTKKKMLKAFGKTAIGGAILALVLFAPTLLSSGLPTQAEYNVWGYMWAIPFYGFFLDYLPLLVLISLFIVPFLATKEVKFDRLSARMLLFLALFVAIQLTISYRINVVATIAFALVVGMLFPKRVIENRLSAYSLGALIGVTLMLMFLLITSFYPVPQSAQNAFAFVKTNTSTEANFLNEPYIGHDFIFLAERKALSDLAVEYADAEMIQDSFEFIKTGNRQILSKYDIDYVVNRSIFLSEKPVGNNLWHELLEYEELDKIYSNGLFFVHRVEKN